MATHSSSSLQFDEPISLNESVEKLISEKEVLCKAFGGFSKFKIKFDKSTNNTRRGNLEIYENIKEINGKPSDNNGDNINEMDLFFKYLQKFDEELLESENEITNLEVQWLEDADQLLQKMDKSLFDSLEHLEMLKSHKNKVQNNVDGLYSACDMLLREKNMAESTIEAVKSGLLHYSRFEELKRRLENPSTLTDIQQYKRILERVDKSIEFFQIHTNYCESSNYLRGYQSLRQAAFYIARSSLVECLNKCQLTIEKSQGKQKAASTQVDSSTYYTKFKTVGMKIKPVMSILLDHAETDTSGDYAEEINHLEEIYFSVRTRILDPVLETYLKSIVHKEPSLASAIRETTTYILSICHLELSVFHSFFPPSSPRLNVKKLLERFGGIYYELLNPLVRSCDDLDVLREAAGSLSIDVLEPHRGSKQSSQIASLLSIIYKLHKDVQERILFCVERYIQDDIIGYIPTPEDLDYPSKLKLKQQQVEDPQNLDPTALWYPTLRRSLLCLTKTSRIIDAPTFHSIAQEMIAVCLNSLIHGSNLIAMKNKELDAQLFLIKNILILREQVSIFDCDLTQKENSLDISGVKTHLWNILSGDSKSLNINQTKLDSKEDLESHLKSTCEKLVATTTAKLMAPISFIFSISRNEGDAAADNYDRIKEEGVMNHLQVGASKLYNNLESSLPELTTVIRLYLDEVELSDDLHEVAATGDDSLNAIEASSGGATMSITPNIHRHKSTFLISAIKRSIITTVQEIEKHVIHQFQYTAEDLQQIGWRDSTVLSQQLDAY